MPVGEDQKQHLELARDIAGAFNRRYERDFFPLPEPQIFGAATRVMSLRDGTKKMSKSDTSDYSRINMTDDADTIALKIRTRQDRPRAAARRRSQALEARPEADNLVGIYAALADADARSRARADLPARTSRNSRRRLSELAVDVLGRIGGEMRRLMADPGYIDSDLAPRRRARGGDRRCRSCARSRTSAACCGRKRRLAAFPLAALRRCKVFAGPRSPALQRMARRASTDSRAGASPPWTSTCRSPRCRSTSSSCSASARRSGFSPACSASAAGFC